MTLEEFQRFASDKGCRVIENGAFGVYKGYPYALRFQPRQGSAQIDFQLERNPGKVVNQGIRRALPKGCGFQLGQDGTATLSILCNGRGEGVIRQMEASLEIASSAFQEAGVRPPERCPICRQAGCDATAFIKGYVPVHRACVEANAGAQARQEEDNRRNGNYFSGMIGALLGGLVGAIPAVLMRDFGNYLVAVLYALIPLAAHFGYQLFRGKRTKAAFVITILFSVVDLILMRLGIFFAYMVDHYHVIPSPSDLVEAYFQSYGAMEIAPDLLFLGLGLLFAWSSISRTGKQEVEEAFLISQTLLPQEAPMAQAGGQEKGEAQ